MADPRYVRKDMLALLDAPKPDHATILKFATHYQGGHSDVGDRIAEFYGIPFPLTMENLRSAALKRGLKPAELWPWWSGAIG